ncbi:PD-(D/E)XK motif protein [bacterium]|nr:PD-(D/E)XK motif protein [bacterium]
MTDSTLDFFRDDPWDQIQSPCYPQGRRLYLNDERFWVSMDEHRQLLFFAQEQGGFDIKPLENLAGLNVTIEKLSGNNQRLVCRLISNDRGLEEKFSTVAKDIAHHCSPFKGRQLFLKIQQRIKSWAEFLKPSHTGLTNSEFLGFFGELYVLSQHLIPAVQSPNAVEAWIGPDNKKQDFTFNSIAFEVKTTLSGNKQAIKISSLDQLDVTTGKLFLVRVVASPAGSGIGFSLNELHESCLQALTNDIVAEAQFLQKASKLFNKATKSQLEDRYVVNNPSIFEVVEEFPKLTSRSVGLAILKANYEISLSALSDFEMEENIGEIISNG